MAFNSSGRFDAEHSIQTDNTTLTDPMSVFKQGAGQISIKVPLLTAQEPSITPAPSTEDAAPQELLPAAQALSKDRSVWRELLSELIYLEAKGAYWALQAAVPADMDRDQLMRQLRADNRLREIGQVAMDEMLSCLQCGHRYLAKGIITVSPCECGCEHFYIGEDH